MHEEHSILPLVVAGVVLAGVGFEVDRRRKKLRQVFNTFDKQESRIAEALESLVRSGQLKPYFVGGTHS